MRNSSNDLRHLSFAESAPLSSDLLEAVNTSKPLSFDALEWWAAGKLLSTGPARPACRECEEAMK